MSNNHPYPYAVVEYDPVVIVSWHKLASSAGYSARKRYAKRACGVMAIIRDDMGYILGVRELTRAEQNEAGRIGIDAPRPEDVVQPIYIPSERDRIRG